MKKLNASIAVAAALLLSGTAFAGTFQPASGEAPFADQPVAASSTLQRQDVRADAARHMPAAGEMNAQAEPERASTVTRAEVREATRQAIASGFRPATGEAA
ncbi:MAG: hypothetical protein R3E52_11015 [Burkholderiaceae bacterium]